VIRETARILIRAIQQYGKPDDFIGHIGGDDFVVITTAPAVDNVCQAIIAEFEKTVPSFYNETDRSNGYIIAHDRKGQEQKVPLLSFPSG